MIRISVAPDGDRAAASVAAFIAGELQRRPALSLGLPTGRTPIRLYDYLVEWHRRGAIDFSRARTFNLDEFVGIAGSDPRSYCAFMRQHLFAHVNLRARAIHVPDGMARNLEQAARRYDAAIAAAGGLDICLLGIGSNGHIGFNEPAGALRAETHVATLARSTRASNADLFGGRLRDVPSRGLTVGMGAILGARTVVLIATGAAKAEVIRRAFSGAITTRIPASLLQAHPDVRLVLDRAAAARLRPRSSQRRSG